MLTDPQYIPVIIIGLVAFLFWVIFSKGFSNLLMFLISGKTAKQRKEDDKRLGQFADELGDSFSKLMSSLDTEEGKKEFDDMVNSIRDKKQRLGTLKRVLLNQEQPEDRPRPQPTSSSSDRAEERLQEILGKNRK